LSAYALDRGSCASASPQLRAGTAGLVARGRRLVAAYLAWRERRATMRALAALDDRALKDIGLSRGEIGSAAVCGRRRRAT
jgi:uncharacterized protein YjiS (DUF1127 family)